LLRWATYASVTTATMSDRGKLAAALMTGSVSVLASLVDSMMDVAASIINLLAVHYALQPPDRDHRFGHGKAEPLAGLAQAAFIAGSAVFLILHAVDRLRASAADTGCPESALACCLFAMVATGRLLLAFQHYVIRRTQSTAIRADALHYATDLLTNGATIVALGWRCWVGLSWIRFSPSASRCTFSTAPARSAMNRFNC
jgi:ferrous-iron efflux pump FieF